MLVQSCHQTYVTRYSPHQEEECSEQFKKECQLRREKVQQEEAVEVCRTVLTKNCSTAGSPEPEDCRTMYESECWTKYEHHEVSISLIVRERERVSTQVEDDVPDCRTVTEPRCDETGENCVSLAREECSLERRTVVKTTPLTGCDKVQDGHSHWSDL